MKQISHFSGSEIKEIFEKARCHLRHASLTLLCVPAKQATGRILIITPRKVGNSPQRNRIRRRIKAIFYEEKLFERGLDCVVIVKASGIKLDFDELKKMIVQALQTPATP